MSSWETPPALRFFNLCLQDICEKLWLPRRLKWPGISEHSLQLKLIYSSVSPIDPSSTKPLAQYNDYLSFVSMYVDLETEKIVTYIYRLVPVLFDPLKMPSTNNCHHRTMLTCNSWQHTCHVPNSTFCKKIRKILFTFLRCFKIAN